MVDEPPPRRPGPRATIASHEGNSELLILDRAEVEAATGEIRNDNSIRKPFSDDLKDFLAPAGRDEAPAGLA